MSDILFYIIGAAIVLPFIFGLRYLAKRHGDKLIDEAKSAFETQFGVEPDFTHGFGKTALGVYKARDLIAVYNRDTDIITHDFANIDHWFVGKIKTEIVSSQAARSMRQVDPDSNISARSAESHYVILSNDADGLLSQVGILNADDAQRVEAALSIVLPGKEIDKPLYKKTLAQTLKRSG